jgi:hypothetical protein
MVAHSVIMSDSFPESIDSPPSEIPSSAVWAVSLAFWIVLLSAALMYGSVALAPRLSAWMEIRHDFINNAHQLQALETEVDYLERVRDAMESDPAFVRRLASAAIAEDVGDAEVIPVSGTLIFGSGDQLQQRLPEVDEPVGANIVRWLASERGWRNGLLTVATLLVVFAFTVLNGTGGWFARVVIHLSRAAVRMPLERYRRDALLEAETNGVTE